MAPSKADISTLLARRTELDEKILSKPYDCIHYLERAAVYADLDYPDLAAGDAYHALLLTDEARTDGFEYHEVARGALEDRMDSPVSMAVIPFTTTDTNNGHYHVVDELLDSCTVGCYHLLSANLLRCGCLRSALTFAERGLAALPAGKDHAGLRATRAAVLATLPAAKRNDPVPLLLPLLPDRGSVRREVYPWNHCEPDRCSDESIAFLNALLQEAAPKCEVRATDLPVLTPGAERTTCRQLGVFAKEAIAPGEAVLREYSLLTANNRLKDALCDACGSSLDSMADAVPCPDCDDIVFCDAFCREQADARYHGAVCSVASDLDAVAKDPDDPHAADEALYLLLLARVLAMAAHEDGHPLDVDEVRFLYGDFGAAARLPFSFDANIAAPLHVLEKMDIDIYDCSHWYDTWVFNTLYAKFRGTASARKSRRDGRPDVAAVHPLWCLANHSCDPNVTWEWGGRMVLWAREQRVPLRPGEEPRPGGIVAGEEILNHYCDIDLPVQQRREWASGSLGGICMCQRCQREAAEEAEGAKPIEGA